jgi:hypothetical protein
VCQYVRTGGTPDLLKNKKLAPDVWFLYCELDKKCAIIVN